MPFYELRARDKNGLPRDPLKALIITPRPIARRRYYVVADLMFRMDQPPKPEDRRRRLTLRNG